MNQQSSQQPALTVSELTSQLKEVLEGCFPSIWVSGEVSECTKSRPGHIYLTLKDPEAVIRGVIWRTTAARLPFDVQEGTEVVCEGYIDLYPPRGSYQLVIRKIEPKGVGALELAFRQLQEKLSAEGLFDPARKKSLPRFPRRIAVVTSPTGAALQDFLKVLQRRWRDVEVMVIPTRVQGEGVSREIAQAIASANRIDPKPDVLVVTRGGGSMEDLWCFNEEPVVRAIFASVVPVISAVGHEIDVTLADLVADVRALTPSEAAERVVPSAEEMRSRLIHYQDQLRTALRRSADRARASLESLASRRVFRTPRDRVHESARRVDELEMRRGRAVKHRLSVAGQRLSAVAGKLESLSPLAVLARGYSLTQRADGSLVHELGQVETGERIATRLSTGRIISRVEEVNEE